MKNLNFTCPFCSLLCDDIQLEIKENNLKPLNSTCSILVNSLKKKINEQFSRIDGKKTNISQAINDDWEEYFRPPYIGLGIAYMGNSGEHC